MGKLRKVENDQKNYGDGIIDYEDHDKTGHC